MNSWFWTLNFKNCILYNENDKTPMDTTDPLKNKESKTQKSF